MQIYLVLVVATCASLPDFYHTTEYVRVLITNLADTSSHVHGLDTETVDAVDLYIEGGEGKLQTTVICGEHPRELISVEVCLDLLLQILHSPDILNTTSIRIILNANPEARKQVESGSYCLRTNLNGVDINRNWDTYWQPADCSKVIDCPGSQAMSEPQVLEINQLLATAPPDIFLTIHSGSYGILTPFAYTEMEELPKDIGNMITVLSEIAEELPDIEVQEAASALHYTCPGNILDYVYSNYSPRLAAVFEVYSYNSPFSSFISPSNDCFSIFNPDDLATYREVIDQWNSALLRLLSFP